MYTAVAGFLVPKEHCTQQLITWLLYLYVLLYIEIQTVPCEQWSETLSANTVLTWYVQATIETQNDKLTYISSTAWHTGRDCLIRAGQLLQGAAEDHETLHTVVSWFLVLIGQSTHYDYSIHISQCTCGCGVIREFQRCGACKSMHTVAIP